MLTLEELIEYAIIGTLAIAALFLIAPTIIDFFDTAVVGVENSSGLSASEGTLVTSVLLLVVLFFFLSAVLIMYGAVKDKYT